MHKNTFDRHSKKALKTGHGDRIETFTPHTKTSFVHRRSDLEPYLHNAAALVVLLHGIYIALFLYLSLFLPYVVDDYE